MRKSPTSQTEKAFVAYVQGNQADTALETVNVYAAGLAGSANSTAANANTFAPQPGSPPVLYPPSLMFSASNPEKLNPDDDYYELKLTACLSTEVFDDQVTDAEDVHRERLEVLRNLLEDTDDVQAYVNAPVSGTDNRAVQNFSLSGITYLDEDTKISDNDVMTDLFYYVLASPSDS